MGGCLMKMLCERQAAGWDAVIAVASVTQDSSVHILRSAVPAPCTLLYCALSMPAKWQPH